jgi:hypothetical protein
LLTVLMPLAQLVKSTACMPSTLISRTRLIWWELLFWAIAVPIEQAAARKSKASVFFIVTSSHKPINAVLLECYGELNCW